MPAPQRISFPEEELAILQLWDQKECFKKQLQITKNMPKFTFYDGPPFATGTPHYGHICAGTIKDVVCRYASQTGHYVSRRFGWDCHGLPVQYQIDKELEIKDKRQVEQMGIQKYNAHCRAIVMKYSGEWEHVVNRFARWIDFKNDYKTMDINFMQSVWHVFKKLFQKKLIYRGRKIMPYSNGCTTVLSNFEVQLNYKDVDDPSLYVNFPLLNQPTTQFLVWTTTPWTLPSNLALAVNANFDYVKIKDLKRNQVYIIAECRLKAFYGKDKKAYEVLQKMKGSELEGIQYVPIFDFFQQRRKDGCFRVQIAEFVTDDAGTGVVHCAPGFGQEDYKMCVDKKIIHPDDPPVPLDQNGKFTEEVSTYKGIQVKDADKIIIKDLKEKGRVVKSDNMKHSYPYCWRSDTPLIYKAVSTWFIKVTELKDDLMANNLKANWIPKNIQEKRFHNWLKQSKDWCFSRNRYWGNPIPLWVSQDGQEVVCIGSVNELEQLTGSKITDLHRQHIDHLTIESKKGKGKLRRIEEVFDCWFQSGSMPYAQVHYPFSTSEEQFEKIFPADFIGEGIDQTRGWFYTLNVISTGLKNMHPYKNLIVNGLVQDQNGKKMSKRDKNYPDPLKMCSQFGADAVRLYLINSPLVHADNLKFTVSGVKAVVKDIFLPWYNAYRFLIQNITKRETKTEKNFVYKENLFEMAANFNVTDHWIQSQLQVLLQNVRKEMDQYKLYNVVPVLIHFLQLLTNWYVRLNRPRIKGEAGDIDTQVSLTVLFDVLLKLNVLMSPHVPFLTEYMYQNMRIVISPQSKLYQDSIHHLMISDPNPKLIDNEIAGIMANFMSIIETGRKLKESRKISLKQPTMSLTVISKSQQMFDKLKPFLPYIEEEVNVIKILNETDVGRYLKLEAKPNLPIFGPKFKANKNAAEIKAAIGKLTTQELQQYKEQGKIIILGATIQKGDLLLQEKFINDNVKENEAIGGDKVTVLLNIEQNQELRIKGYAREIINRIQKLKKKLHLTAEDQIIVFYETGKDSPYLNAALTKEFKIIANTVKKPLYPVDHLPALTILGQDKGSINQEQYSIYITVFGVFPKTEALKEDFGGKEGLMLQQCLLTMPYKSIKGSKTIEIRLDGKDYVLSEGKHFNVPS